MRGHDISGPDEGSNDSQPRGALYWVVVVILVGVGLYFTTGDHPVTATILAIVAILCARIGWWLMKRFLRGHDDRGG